MCCHRKDIHPLSDRQKSKTFNRNIFLKNQETNFLQRRFIVPIGRSLRRAKKKKNQQPSARRVCMYLDLVQELNLCCVPALKRLSCTSTSWAVTPKVFSSFTSGTKCSCQKYVASETKWDCSTLTGTYMYTHACTRTRARTHTHTHTHTRSRSRNR